jgi:hypothetical protein
MIRTFDVDTVYETLKQSVYMQRYANDTVFLYTLHVSHVTPLHIHSQYLTQTPTPLTPRDP